MANPETTKEGGYKPAEEIAKNWTGGRLEVVPASLFEKATRLAALIQGMEPGCRRLFCELLEREMHPPRMIYPEVVNND